MTITQNLTFKDRLMIQISDQHMKTGQTVFTLQEIYKLSEDLKQFYPKNNTYSSTICSTMQIVVKQKICQRLKRGVYLYVTNTNNDLIQTVLTHWTDTPQLSVETINKSINFPSYAILTPNEPEYQEPCLLESYEPMVMNSMLQSTE